VRSKKWILILVMGALMTGLKAQRWPTQAFLFSGGLRFHPRTEESSIDPEAREKDRGRLRNRYSDQWQAAGVILKSPDLDSGPLTARLEAGILYTEGRQTLEEDAPSEPVAILPGNHLALSYNFHEDGALILGRYHSGEFDSLLGGHGSLTGIHVRYSHSGLTVIATPYHRYALAGTFLPLAEDPPGTTVRSGPDGAALHAVMRRRQRNVFQKEKEDSYGQRIASTFSHSIFRLALAHGTHVRDEDAYISGPRYVSRIHYSSLGLGIISQTYLPLEVFLTAERSLGQFRTLYRASPEGKFQEVDGTAISLRFALKAGPVAIRLDGFLPEAPERYEDAAGNKHEKSGYIGFADHLLLGWPMLGSLGARPFPELCSGENCTEEESIARKGSLPYFQDHAGLARLRISAHFQESYVQVGAGVLRPLALRTTSATNPFARQKGDIERPDYIELSLLLHHRVENGQLELSYGRLIERGAGQRVSRLAGESIYLAASLEL